LRHDALAQESLQSGMTLAAVNDKNWSFPAGKVPDLEPEQQFAGGVR